MSTVDGYGIRREELEKFSRSENETFMLVRTIGELFNDLKSTK